MDWWIVGGILLILAVLIAAVVIGFFVFPRRTVRAVFKPLLWMLYRKRLVGLENLPRTGGAFIVANHVSWIDGILILWMLPRNVRFIVDGGNFNGGFMERLAGAFDTILMSRSPKSIGRALRMGRDAVRDGDLVGLFPEGTLTRSGMFQGFRPGLSKMLKDRPGPVVPVWLDGMWGSIFSYSEGRFFRKWPRDPRRILTLHIGEPLPAETPLPLIRSRLAALGAEAMKARSQRTRVLPRRLLRSWKRRGNRLKAADSTKVEVSGRELLLRTLVLRRVLAREHLGNDQCVGLLLPPSVAAVASNVALSFDRRVAVNLNYTATSDTLNACIATAGIRKVLTSRKFMEKFDFQLDAELVYLEDIRPQVRRSDKLAAAVATYATPSWLLERVLGLQKIKPDDLLTIVFTSGSTGTPKGVMLSYANIGHNVDAIDGAIRLNDQDVVLGILPFFHSFGYSVTLWGAMTLSPAAVYHFNPLDGRTVGNLAERYKATVLLGTPTFLRGYLRRIPKEQFAWLDVVVAGAEKMPRDLFEAFETRFGVRPIEGYGATELSPLVSVNIPPTRSHAKYQPDRCEGSVGRPVAGVAARIVDPETMEEIPGDAQEGMLMISGPNVMRGYMGRPDLTAEVIFDGWYRTGDIARIDSDGFIHITGRQSRFSKIGGEMVPHLRVEEELLRLIAEGGEPEEGDAEEGERPLLVVTSVADQRKGERLIVLHRPISQTPEQLRAGLIAAGLSNLYLPAVDAFFEVEDVPLLGTGKLDLKGAQQLAEQLTADRGVAQTE
ncbi:AMP-binding protein [Candidatus Laterigemmans baculatus]|uniref:AMP-binding protein n=1 Tax=Candidatus Laterigemmans baculatus TaxID=2770505 RepID=UPI0013DD0977|nr:AMP-binding protein [Candidatus Laterigemmans baculatus]